MQIHELNSFVGTPGAGDYLAIDDGSETTKVEASNLGVSTQMTQAEAEAGTVTASRVVAPSIFKSAVTAIASAITGVFVLMTDPKYTLDTSAASGDDYNLTQVLTSLGWLSDIVTNGVLGVKKLLYKILQNQNEKGTTTFTATRFSSATDGTFIGMYNAKSGIVTIAFSIRLPSETPTATALWTIPSKYRPKLSVSYTIIVYNGAGVPISFNGSINTNGSVTQLATGTCRQAFGVATYNI